MSESVDNSASSSSSTAVGTSQSPATTLVPQSNGSSATTPTIPSSVDLLSDSKIEHILNSDSSLDLLLSRLKQSIKASDEFALFLKRKYNFEESYIRDMKRVSSNCKNSIRAGNKVVKGSFIESLEKVISFDDRIVADVRTPYIKALEKMHDELVSLSSNLSRLRKAAKDDGSRKEKEVQDAINQADKSKHKYYSLCSDLERLRNTDQSQKKITLQGRKTGSQQEEELIKKIQVADQDYNSKAYASQRLKNELIKVHRPKISKRLKDLILEIDTALQLQLQKYSAYNESLVIGMGNQIAPLGSNHISMKAISSSVDVEKCLSDHLRGSRIETKSSFIPVEYKRHILFGGSKATPQQKRAVSNSSVGSIGVPAATIPVNSTTVIPPSFNKSTVISAPTSISSPLAIPQSQTDSTHPLPVPSASHLVTDTAPPYSTLDPARSPAVSGPRAIDAPAFGHSTLADGVNNKESSSVAVSTPTATSGQLFGCSIEEVPHDEEMVPFFVKRCIQLIEAYGTNSEGIYRSSPNKAKLEELKSAIDQDPTNLSLLDPIDPQNVTDDYVFIIASLLKNFFSELPDPLLTREQSANFFKAGQIEDEPTMRVQLHRIVFELPDANYFTLRDLLFHFANLSAIPKVRMNVKNLSIVWSNNLLVNEFTNKDDLFVQQRVIEELIFAAQDIFNPKDE